MKKRIENFFHGREELKSVTKNSVFLTVDNIFRLASGLVLGAMTARVLGPTQYGTLSYATVVVTLFAPIATLGIERLLVRDVVHGMSPKKILGSSITLKFFGFFLSYLSAITLLFLTDNSSSQNLLLVTLISLASLFQTFDVIDYYFQAKLQTHITVRYKFFAFLLISIFRLSLIVSDASIYLFASTLLIECMMNAVLLLLALTRKHPEVTKWSVDLSYMKNILMEGFPAIIASFAFLLQFKVDQIILVKFVSKALFAQYSIAISLIESTTFISMILLTTLLPVLSKTFQSNRKLYYDQLQASYSIIFLLFLGLVLFLLLIGRWLISLIYGPGYEMTSTYTLMYSLKFLLSGYGVLKAIYYVNKRAYKFSMISGLTGAVLSTIFCLILIPRYGVVGAIVGVFTSALFSFFVTDWLFERTRINAKLLIQSLYRWDNIYKLLKPVDLKTVSQ